MGDAGSFFKRSLLAALVFGLVATGCSGGSKALKQDGAESLARLQKVEVKDTDLNTIVVLTVDGPVNFTSVRLPDPPKMVVDLAGVDLGGFTEKVEIAKPPVASITPLKVPNAKRIARLDIALTVLTDVKTTQTGNTINIIFEKPKAAAAPLSPPEKVQAADAATEKAPETASVQPQRQITEKPDAPKPETVKVADSAPAKAVEKAPAKAVEKAPVKAAEKAPALPPARTVKAVRLSRSGERYDVIIEGDGSFTKPDVFMLGKDRIVIDLPGVGSAKEKEAIEAGGKTVKRVRMAHHKEGKEKVRVVIDLAAPAKYEVKAEGRALVVSVGETAPEKAAKQEKAEKPAQAAVAAAPPARKPAQVPAAAAPPAKAEAVSAPAKKPGDGLNVYISQVDGRAVISSTPLKEGPGMPRVEDRTKDYVETSTKIYTGGRISFDIQDADLDKVVKLLADVAGLNLILDPNDVRGKVTLKLDNVPWDQALDILLKIYNLDKVIEGNVLRVAPKAKLDDERRRELLQAAEQKKLEQQAEDLYTKTFKVNYTTATELEPQVKKILSSRGDATANPRTNELVVTDIRANLEKAGQLIIVLDKEVNQIMIEARIVTVDVGFSQSLGVSWGLTRKSSTANPNAGVASGNEGLKSDSTGPDGAHSYQLNLPAAVDAAAGASGGLLGAFSWGSVLKGVNIDLTISALETISKAETLAAPKVLTLENQAATITQGITLYVQTTTAAGTAPQPLNANLSLTVTPRVTGDNFIMLDVNATKNEPRTPPSGATASIDTNAVTTKVIVKDGDTIVLGGIYTKKKDYTDSQVPFLGRIPIIGWLFKQRSSAAPTSELLIFITPKLVRAQKV